jgi:hypothetical protein
MFPNCYGIVTIDSLLVESACIGGPKQSLKLFGGTI